MHLRQLKKFGLVMLSFMMITSLITVIPMEVSASAEIIDIGIDVKQVYNADVVLALGDSTQDVTSFKENLMGALIRRGMSPQQINIQTVEAQEKNILEGTFKLNLFWPKGTSNIDMDSHVEFWSGSSKFDELYYSEPNVYGSILDYDDTVGGVGEWITLNFETVPSQIDKLRVYINPYNGEVDSTMYLYKTVNGQDEIIIQNTIYVDRKVHFGDFIRNEDSWDFHYSDGRIFAGKEVQINSKDFLEVIREPNWSETAKRYLVNLNDETIADFDDSGALGEIITRMDNDQIHYLGWGEDSDQAEISDRTQNQAESFIEKNNNKGIFINRSGQSYAQQIEKMAQYIYTQTEGRATSDYIELGNQYELSVTPATELTNTIDEQWPEGKWKVEHDPTIYENNSGTVSYSGKYLNHLEIPFEKVGKYDLYYKDVLVKTLYVHRKPEGRFTVSVDSNYIVTVNNLSIDHDSRSRNNGIASSQWKWKRTNDTGWTEGLPTNFEENEDYIIQLKVQDFQGAWSTALSRYQTTTQSGHLKPLSEFYIYPSELVLPSHTISIDNISYDPASSALVEEEWTVYKNNQVIYTGLTPKLAFSDVGAGEYKISMRTKNNAGVWSEWFSRFLTIKPNTVPSITSLNDATIKEGQSLNNISFQISDEETGAYDLVVTASSSNEAIVPSTNLVVTGYGSNRLLSVTPIAGVQGQVTITLMVSDGVQTKEEAFLLTIIEKEAPEITAVDNQSINIGGSTDIIEFVVTDEIYEADLLQVSATSSNQDLIPNTNIILGGTGGNRTIQLTALPDKSGETVITIEVTDAGGHKGKITFSITVSDLTPPNIVSYQLESATGYYVAGDTIIVSALFDEDVYVDGSPVIALDFGNHQTRQATYLGGSGSDTLIYAYTVQAGDYATSVIASANLQLNGGTIKDANENFASLILTSDVNLNDVVVDAILPDKPHIAALTVKGNTSITILAVPPTVGETAWLAPSGTTSFVVGSTMTKLVGDGETASMLTPLSEGSYKLFIIDAAGNVSLESDHAITVDNTAPSMAIVTLPIEGDNVINNIESQHVSLSGTAEANSKLEITFTDRDENNVILYTNADADGKWSLTGINEVNLSEFLDGTINIYIKVIDTAGNESIEAEVTVIKDSVSPSNQDLILTHSKYAQGGTIIELDSASSDDKIFIAPYGTTAENMVANGDTITSVVGSYSAIYTPLLDGSYNIFVMDSAGNLSLASQSTLLVDNASPSIESISRSTTEWTHEAVTFVVSANDLGSGIAEIKFAYGNHDEDYFITNGTTVANNQFQAEMSGTYTVYVSDYAGNKSVRTIEVTNIDKEKPTSPVIHTTPNRDFYNQDYLVTIEGGQDTVSGSVYTEYRLSVTGSVYTDWTVYHTPIEIVEDGTTTIEARTYDNAGNVSDISSKIIVINRLIAVFPSIFISPNRLFSNEDITVTITKEFDDTGLIEGEYATVYYRLSGMDQFVVYDGPFIISTEGQTDIEVKIIDRAGNESSMIRTVNLDKTAPDNQENILLGNVVTQGNTIININSSVDSEDTIWLAPIGTTNFVEGTTMTKASGSSAFILSPLVEGVYSIYVMDKSGNISLPSEITMTVDNTSPTVAGIVAGSVYKEFPIITFDEGIALLNGSVVTSGVIVGLNGSYAFVLTDVAGNSTVISFVVDNDEESATKDQQALQLQYALGDSAAWISKDIVLETEGLFGSHIIWSSSDETLISSTGQVTNGIVDTLVTLTATITKGLITLTKAFDVLVIADPVSPIISLIGSSIVTVEQGELYVDFGAQAVDNVDGNITDNITIQGVVDTNRLGTYKLIYKVNDKAGNIAQVERQINVVKATKPANTIVTVEENRSTTDQAISDALTGAQQQGTLQVVLILVENVSIEHPIHVSLGKNQVQYAHDNNIKIELQVNNVSFTVPVDALDMSLLEGNSRLELVIEHIDVTANENKELVDAIKDINSSMEIYQNKVFDFKLRVIEEDHAGNVLSSKDIENFQSDEDIVLSIYIGTDIDADQRFMTFYYNETTKGWEYIRSSYDSTSGNIELYTTHLSIYSVTHMTKAEKQAELAKVMNKGNITIQEVRSIIEDEDLDLDINALEKYDAFTATHKNAVAQQLIDLKPIKGYDYTSLSNQYLNTVNDKYNQINTDNVAPVLELNGSRIEYVVKGKVYYELGATATDNQDGDITGRIIKVGSVDTSKPGVYTLRYQVQDVNGNKAEIVRTVYVIEQSHDFIDEKVKQGEASSSLPVTDDNNNQPAFSMTFNDLDGHWAKDIVEKLAAKQIITGDENGNFNPNLGITRAEFSALIVRMLNLPLKESTSVFEDLNGKWYASYIATAYEQGIIKGVSDTAFEPDRIVKRQEMAAMIIRTVQLYKEVNVSVNDTNQFKDTDDIGQWAVKDVYAAKELGLMVGRTGNVFAPRSPTLRSEAASVIYNLLKLLELI